VQNFRETTVLPIDAGTLKYQGIWAVKSRNFISIDTEFWSSSPSDLLSSPDLLMELLYNPSGYEILNTTINHNCVIEDLYDRSVSGVDLYRGALREIYGPPTRILTPGLMIDEVADVLETYGFGKDIHMVE